MAIQPLLSYNIKHKDRYTYMPGTVDPFYGIGRSSYERCRWWKRQAAINYCNGKLSYEVVCHNLAPEGEFMAEETTPVSSSMNGIGDIRNTRRTVTISTIADIDGDLQHDDLVEYQGRIWKVQSISNTEFWARSYYGRRNRSGTKSIVLVS